MKKCLKCLKFEVPKVKTQILNISLSLCLFVIKTENILFGINPDDKIDENMSEFIYGTMIEQC